MPISVPNPYSGEYDQTCSVSFAAQQQFLNSPAGPGGTGASNGQTEAEFNKSKLTGEWGVIKAKLKKGEIPDGTKVLTYTNAGVGSRGYLFVKSGDLWKTTYTSTGGKTQGKFDPDKAELFFKSDLYDVAIPQAVAAKPKPEVDPLKALTKDDMVTFKKTASNGEVVAVSADGHYQVTYHKIAGFTLSQKGEYGFLPQDASPSGLIMHAKMKATGQDFFKPDASGKAPTVTPPPPPAQVAAPTASAPVNTGSASPGSMSHEDVSAMFVKIKDDLAKEQGLNVKGANPALDQLVYKAIGDKTGYTADEVKAKIDAYKAAGNKLSALKKKVMAGKYKVPEGKNTGTAPQATKATPAAPLNTPKKTNTPVVDPQPNGVPTVATPSLANAAKADVQEAVSAAPTKVYSDEDVAAAYIIAKDKIVAASNGKWTLYTKSDELDMAIAIEVGLNTGGLNPLQQKEKLAAYLASGKKLSVLKKQLIKQGTLKPQADTLKKKATTPATPAAAANAGYTPDNTPNPVAPIPTAPFTPRARPAAADLTFTGKEVGTHHAKIYKDKLGNNWLFKPQEQFLTEVDVATSKLAKVLGHPAADTYSITLDGKKGSLQRMFPGGDSFPGGLQPTTAPTAHLLAVQKEQVLDWLWANHDSHSDNFVFDEHGNVVGIDKGQALKFFGKDELSYKITVNQFEPAANKIWKEWAAGKNVALNDPTAPGELKDFIDKVMALPDKELKDIFRPYAEAAKAKGVLLTGTHWKSGVLGKQTLKTNDVEVFLDELVKRKNSLADDFAKLHAEAKAERAKHVKPTDPDPVTANPGAIDHIPEATKDALYKRFKSYGYGTYLNSSTEAQLYDSFAKLQIEEEAKGNKYSILQLIRIVDEQGAKKFNAENAKLFEKKVATWLTTPAGAKHIKDAEAKLIQQKEEAKKAAEIAAAAEKLKANQPSLPPDSAGFTIRDKAWSEKFWNDNWQDGNGRITDSGKAALRYYTTNPGYTALNGQLRGLIPETDEVMKKAKQAVGAMTPAPEGFLVHRGTTAKQFGFSAYGDDDKLWGITGRTFTDKGFLSTSTGGKAAFGSKPVLMEIEVIPGTPIQYVDTFSAYPGENELLLTAGCEYKVLRVEERNGKMIVRMRVTSWPGKDD